MLCRSLYYYLLGLGDFGFAGGVLVGLVFGSFGVFFVGIFIFVGVLLVVKYSMLYSYMYFIINICYFV